MKMRFRLTALLLAVMTLLTTAAPALATTLDLATYQQMLDRSAGGSEPIITEGGQVYTMDNTAAPAASGYDSTTTVQLAANAAGSETEQSVTLPYYGKVVLASAIGNGQWQVQVGDQWVNMHGETASTLEVTLAKVQSLFEMNDCAKLRHAAADGSAISNVASIELSYNEQASVAPLLQATVRNAVAPLAEGEGEEDIPGLYTVEIAYLFANGQPAATSYTATIAEGSDLTTSVIQLPKVVGYLATCAHTEEDGVTFVQPTDTTDGSIQLKLKNVTEHKKFTVTYEPTFVDFKVEHYLMGMDSDKSNAEHQEGDDKIYSNNKKTGEAVGAELARTYEGFRALWYDDTTPVAADGSTVIKIYYERKWYLMLFDLDGGYGVEPIYAQYGASIGDVSAPTKAGYTFSGWAATEDGTVNADLPPQTMPCLDDSNGRITYYAIWAKGTANYTINYWLENANDNDYSYLGSSTVSANTGDAVSGGDSANVDLFPGKTKEYYTYNSDKTNTGVVVKADGSTVVNVYYDRKEYTLKFYYMRLFESNYQIPTNTNGYTDYDNRTVSNATWRTVSSSVTVMSSYEPLTGIEVIGGTRYYYLTLTAKYGANLSTVWPNAPFENNGDYKFVSWGTQYGSGYNTNHPANRNIKGVYSIFDEQLIVSGSTEHTLLSYWAIGPTMYNYEIYFSLLDGEESDVQYDGVGYKKQVNFTVGSTAKPSSQSNLTFPGVEYVDMYYANDEIKDGNTIRFYYKRNQHTVTFDNNYSGTTTVNTVYGQVLDDLESTEAIYPDSLEAGAYAFGGWYQDSACTVAADFGITMPDKNLVFYAKWVPVTRNVTIYASEADMNATPPEKLVDMFTVPHGSYAEVSDKFEQKKFPSKEYMESLNNISFVGWFYKETVDGKEVEKAFDPDNMPVTKDLDIYAKWSYNDPIAFKVYYRLADENGNAKLDGNGQYIEVAEPFESKALYGDTITVEAKTGDELKPEYRSGYFPYPPSHSVKLEAVENETVEYVFLYTAAEVVPYRVIYIRVDENGTPLADETYSYVLGEKTVGDNRDVVVTETYKRFDGYMPDAYQKRLIVTSPGTIEDNGNYKTDAEQGENIIFFYYKEDKTHAYWTVEHFLEPIGGVTKENDWQSYGLPTTQTGEIGHEQTAVALDNLSGFTFQLALTELDVYPEDETNNNPLKPNKLTYTLPSGGMDFRLYYIRNEYPVKVQYLEQDTMISLADPELYCADGTNVSRFDYQSQVQVKNNKVIHGYELVGADTQTLQSVAVDGSTIYTIEKNIITFYYKESEVTITYQVVGPDGCGTVDLIDDVEAPAAQVPEPVKALTGEAVGATATPKDNTYKFVGWFTDADCQKPVITEPTETDPIDGTLSGVNNESFVPAKEPADQPDKPQDYYETATFYAKFEYNITTLTIKKTGMNAGETAIFTVTAKTENQEEKTFTVAVPNDGEVTLSGLLIGSTYKVEEKGDWTWRYTSTGINASGTLAANGNTVNFDNTKNKNQWLDDEASVHNDFSKNSSNQ